MTDQASLLRVQKLTQTLQRALKECRPSKGRTQADPGALGDPFERERVRRSAAPSPEVFLSEESEQLEIGLTGAVRTPSQAFLLEESCADCTKQRATDADRIKHFS
jgi:hypothetical protein